MTYPTKTHPGTYCTRKMLYIALAITFTTVVNSEQLPEEKLDVPALIKYWGYPVNTYTTLTDDGYFLTLHRIPHGTPHYMSKKPRPVVFLQHGLLCSSSNWVTNLPRQSLAFMLADAGFDVWLGNVRGNTYSKKHVTYSVDSTAFWDFTFDEMAKQDLPTMIDFVLKETGEKSLYYVGHSQGTMMAFAGLSENAELRKKIKVVFALAPVARLSHTESPIKYLSYFESGFSYMFKLLGIKDFMPSATWMKFFAEKACPISERMCDNVLFLLAGYDRTNLNKTRTPVYLSHTPAGTSVKNMLHFCQLIQEKKFQQYDYGYFGNIRKYGALKPRAYKLNKVTNKVVLISGSKDWLADPKDVKWLSKQLPNVVYAEQVNGYNHLDFIWGMSARNKVYKTIIKMARKMEQSNH